MSEISIHFIRSGSEIDCQVKGMVSSEQIQFVSDAVPKLTENIERISGPWSHISIVIDKDKICSEAFDIRHEDIRADSSVALSRNYTGSRCDDDHLGEEARGSLVAFLRDWCLKWEGKIQPSQDRTLNGLIRIAKQIAIGESGKNISTHK